MAIRTQVRLAQLTGSLNDGGALVGSSIPYVADSLQGSLDQTVAAIKRIHGATSFQNAVAGEFSQAITPNLNSGQDLGSTAKGWDDLFLGDDGVIQLGDDQDTTIIHVPDQGILLNTTRAIQFNKAAESISSPTANDVLIQAAADVELQAATQVIVDSPLLHLEDAGAELRLGSTDVWSATHASNELLVALGDKIAFRATGNSIGSDVADQIDIKAATEIEMTTALVEISGDLTVQGNDLDFAAGAVNVNASGGNANDTVLGSAGGAGGLKIMYDRIKASDGQPVLNFVGDGVFIPGNLTVEGKMTTISSENLEVSDRFIGLNYTTGSISGGAADVGLILAQTGGDTPSNIAFYYDQSALEFKLVSTTSPASGSSIVDAGFENLSVSDLKLKGLDVYGDGTGKAITLTTGNTPDVGVLNNLTITDDKMAKFGNAAEFIIQHAAGASMAILSASSATGLIIGAPVSKEIEMNIADVVQLKVASGFVEVNSKVRSSNAQHLVLSGASGRELQLKSGAELMLGDAFSEAGGWSDIDGIKLAANAASWSSFEAAYGEVALLDAIVSAGGGAGTLQKRTLEVGAAGISAGASVAININLASLPASDAVERVDLFVNGQLMASSSEVTGDGDYSLESPLDATTSATFEFDLVDQDVVTAVVR